jgi:uncharacterized membrane protein
MNRFWMAMCAYVVLAIVAWTELTATIPHSNFQLRHAVLLVLLAMAASTWLHRNDRKGNDVVTGRDRDL